MLERLAFVRYMETVRMTISNIKSAQAATLAKRLCSELITLHSPLASVVSWSSALPAKQFGNAILQKASSRSRYELMGFISHSHALAGIFTHTFILFLQLRLLSSFSALPTVKIPIKSTQVGLSRCL